jgi:hypothetical protein
VPWLESHQELRDHPKTARLRRRLGVNLPQAIGHLHLLWWWALDYADDGDLSAFDPDVIADAGGWEGEAGLFVRALTAAGFLDEDLRIHDWDDYAGRLVDRRAANAQRMREAREARRRRLLTVGPDDVSTEQAGRVVHTDDTIAGRGGLPDTTGPNNTQPDRTGHSQTLSASGKGTAPRRAISADVLEELSLLPPVLDATGFQNAAEDVLTSLGFHCEREVWVGDGIKETRGRIDLLAERNGERLALELDNLTPRQKSLRNLAWMDDVTRVVVLRGPFDGPVPVGLDAVIGNRLAPNRPAKLNRAQPGYPVVPSDASAYTSGPDGRLAAERMAAKLAEE